MKQEYCKPNEQKQMFSDRLHLVKDDNKKLWNQKKTVHRSGTSYEALHN
jgi:hypothetical protein